MILHLPLYFVVYDFSYIFVVEIGLTQLNNQGYSEALEDKLQLHVE